MKRRDFMTTAAVAATTISKPDWLFAGSDNNKYRKDIGIQLYTLRNEIGKDVKATIKAVAAVSYTHLTLPTIYSV